MTEPIRKSVPLTPDEADLLTLLRTPGTPEHEALVTLAGPGADRSDATALHALVTLGRRAILEQALAAGYAAQTAEDDEDDRAARAFLHANLARTTREN